MQGGWQVSTVFVFGSNTEGRHGAGAALHALNHYDAIYGQASGRQGDAYAIITKELRLGKRWKRVTLPDIRVQVPALIEHVKTHPDDTFILTRIGCGLAGFRDDDIMPLFEPLRGYPNVKFPPEWEDGK
jgi:hypothetical protein